MKITAGRRDDIIRQRDEYDARLSELENQYNEDTEAWRNASRMQEDALEAQVLNSIGRTNLDLSVRVSTDYTKVDGEYGYVYRFEVANGERNYDRPFRWSWSIRLDDNGEVLKESSSWSGLKATTTEDLDEIEESVRVLRILNTMDWDELLHTSMPNVEDYESRPGLYSEYNDMRRNRPNFDRDIKDAEIEDSIGKDVWLKMSGRPETDYFYGNKRSTFWVKLLSASPKFVNAVIVRDEGNTRFFLKENWNKERISKDKLYPYIVTPVETKTDDELVRKE